MSIHKTTNDHIHAPLVVSHVVPGESRGTYLECFECQKLIGGNDITIEQVEAIKRDSPTVEGITYDSDRDRFMVTLK